MKLNLLHYAILIFEYIHINISMLRIAIWFDILVCFLNWDCWYLAINYILRVFFAWNYIKLISDNDHGIFGKWQAYGWAYLDGRHNTWEQFYVYWIPSFTGAILAGWIFRFIFLQPSAKVKRAWGIKVFSLIYVVSLSVDWFLCRQIWTSCSCNRCYQINRSRGYILFESWRSTIWSHLWNLIVMWSLVLILA